MFEPGTYQINISSYANSTGKYTIGAEYSSIYKTDEPNSKHDTFETAHELEITEGYIFNGVFGVGNKQDVYKIELTQPVNRLTMKWKLGGYLWSSAENYKYDIVDTTGKSYWINKLENGMTQYGVLASFINSMEYDDICKGYGITTGRMELGSLSKQNRVCI